MKRNLDEKKRNEIILKATRKLRAKNNESRKKIVELENRCEMLTGNLENMSYTMMQNDKALEKVLQANQYLAGQLEVYKKVYGEIGKDSENKKQ